MPAIVPCFGCTRWDGGWYETAHPTDQKVIVTATDFNRRKTADVVLDMAYKPRRLREHSFFLCSVCLLLFDADNGFKERLASKASGYASGGES